jgi:hypothetical protein
VVVAVEIVVYSQVVLAMEAEHLDVVDMASTDWEEVAASDLDHNAHNRQFDLN